MVRAEWCHEHARIAGFDREITAMKERTCAACDYPLDDKAIVVTIGGNAVEVCCEECAGKLKEAAAA